MNSRHGRHKAFESGVVKIQRNRSINLTQSERRACQTLLLSAERNSSEVHEWPIEASQDVLGEIRKRQKLSHSTPKYIDARFVLGSVAKAGRLCCLAANVLTKNRNYALLCWQKQSSF